VLTLAGRFACAESWRCCVVHRRCAYGSDHWIKQIAKTVGLESVSTVASRSSEEVMKHQMRYLVSRSMS